MSKITEEVETIITPILDDLNFELVDVEYAKEGKDRFFFFFIDKEGGVDVASPGAERPLKKEKDYQNAIEQPIFVSLYAPIEGDKEWLGILKSVDDDTITMEVKEKAKKKTIEIPRNKIAKARHAVMI